MMQGKAHISTNNGAQQEYVTDGQNALLVEPGNPHSLATAMKSLITDQDARDRIGNRARADFDSKMNYDIFYRRISDLYKSLFKKSTN
jgi:glycosyltransferase involved in cell wall biosynthesis